MYTWDFCNPGGDPGWPTIPKVKKRCYWKITEMWRGGGGEEGGEAFASVSISCLGGGVLRRRHGTHKPFLLLRQWHWEWEWDEKTQDPLALCTACTAEAVTILSCRSHWSSSAGHQQGMACGSCCCSPHKHCWGDSSGSKLGEEQQVLWSLLKIFNNPNNMQHH